MQNCLVSQPRRTFSQAAMATAIRESGEVIGRTRFFGGELFLNVGATHGRLSPAIGAAAYGFRNPSFHRLSNCHRETVKVRTEKTG